MTQTSKGMNIALWIVQSLLAIMFIMVGSMKLFTPIEKMAEQMTWIKDNAALVRFIGLSELLAGLGLILPSLLKIKPMLTVWAAIGIDLIMVCAIGMHISMGEMNMIGGPILFMTLATFVAWGRSKKAIILPK